MEQMELTFVNEAGATLTAQLEPDMTVNEVIAELINEHFIPETLPMSRWALFASKKGAIFGDLPMGSTGLENGDSVTLYRRIVE